MAVSAKEFWQQLARIGIVDSETARVLAQRYSVSSDKPSNPESDGNLGGNDAVAVAQFLIANQVVTKFQSQRLLAGRAGELRLGEFLVLDRCDRPPLSRWYRGRHVGQANECFLYPCTDSLMSSRWVDPEWLKQHQLVAEHGLQPIKTVTLVASDPWRGAIVSALPEGCSLDQWVSERTSGAPAVRRTLDHMTVALIARVVADSLASMHEANLVHGEVRPSRIWCGADQAFWLLRDAGRPPIYPDESPQEHRWLDDDSCGPFYRAPELDLPDAIPNASTDLFSLGATVFKLVTGRQIRNRDGAYLIPPEVANARDAGPLGEPLLRTIAYAIDPDPAARFSDVRSFSRALTAVIAAYAPKSPPIPPAPELPTAKEPSQNVSLPVDPGQAHAEEPRQSPSIDPKALSVVQTEPDRLPAAVASPRQRVRKKTRRTRRGPIVVGSVAVAILLGIVAIVLRPPADEGRLATRPELPPPRTIDSSQTASAPAAAPSQVKPAAVTGPGRSVVSADGFELIQDDRLLWASPWSSQSEPPPLEMVPPGSQWIITLRLSRLIGDSVKNDWLDWLGPELGPAMQRFEKRSGLSAEQVTRLTIAFSAGSGHPQASYTVTTDSPVSLKDISERWGVTPSRTRDGKTIYTDDTPDGDTYYVRADGETVATFTFGPVDLITLVAEDDGSEIPLARSLTQLWETASVDADFVMIAVPNFLFADGRELLSRFAPRAMEPLRSVLVPDVAAVLVAMGLADRWYLETRFAPSGLVSGPAILQTLQTKIASLPSWGESFAIDGDTDVSWRAMAIRLPQFMRAIADQTRFGISQTLPMLNFYLPSGAAPQVALATVLALSAPERQTATVSAPPPMMALTAEQLLDVNFSISFEQESLEFAVSMIREEFTRSIPEGSTPPLITIVGGDLEKSGITQNQQIRDFQIRGKPLRDALSEIVRQANPDKTATSLNDEKQALVWLVDPTSTPDNPKILITTRPAAEAKQLSLPAEFVGANSG